MKMALDVEKAARITIEQLRRRYRNKEARLLTGKYKGRNCIIEDVTILHDQVYFTIKIFKLKRGEGFLQSSDDLSVRRYYKDEELKLV